MDSKPDPTGRPEAATPRPVEARDQLFGERLLSWALINARDLMVAAQHAAQSGGGLADSIISLGLLPEADTYAALARATEMPLVDLRLVTPDALALRLVPERVARKHVILPVSQDNRTLTYAVARVYDNEAERDVRFAAGREPHPVLAPRSQIAAAIDRYYAHAGQVELLVARIPSQAAVEMFDASSTPGGDDVAPAIQLCNHILADAVKTKASDVHIEPSASGAIIRYRRFSHVMKGDRERCLDAGMDAYVAKPVQREVLLATIDRVLGRSTGQASEATDGEICDADALRARVPDEEILSEVIALFLQECPRMLADVREAVERGDAARIRFTAHTFKGAAGNFGAAPVVEAAALERATERLTAALRRLARPS